MFPADDFIGQNSFSQFNTNPKKFTQLRNILTSIYNINNNNF